MQNTNSYDDIINLKYPLSSHDGVRHPRMAMSERAKIFSPFAALKGYEEAIEGKTFDALTDTSFTAEEFIESE